MGFQYPRCWIVSSDWRPEVRHRLRWGFQYPRCWIVSSDFAFRRFALRKSALSVSSLLDRFLRHRSGGEVWKSDESFSILAVGSFPQTEYNATVSLIAENFQYPRCWIVSSDAIQSCATALPIRSFSILAVGSFPQTRHCCNCMAWLSVLSVSSLLDRFLRQPPIYADGSFGQLSVSSLLDRFLRHFLSASRRSNAWLSVSSLLDRFLRHLRCDRKPVNLKFFQYPRCWIVSSDGTMSMRVGAQSQLSVSSLLDRFLRQLASSGSAWSISLSVSSLLDRFLRQPWVRFNSERNCAFSILAVGSFPQTWTETESKQ